MALHIGWATAHWQEISVLAFTVHLLFLPSPIANPCLLFSNQQSLSTFRQSLFTFLHPTPYCFQTEMSSTLGVRLVKPILIKIDFVGSLQILYKNGNSGETYPSKIKLYWAQNNPSLDSITWYVEHIYVLRKLYFCLYLTARFHWLIISSI